MFKAHLLVSLTSWALALLPGNASLAHGADEEPSRGHGRKALTKKPTQEGPRHPGLRLQGRCQGPTERGPQKATARPLPRHGLNPKLELGPSGGPVCTQPRVSGQRCSGEAVSTPVSHG